MFTTSSSERGVSRTPSNTNLTRVRQPVRLLLVDPLPVVHRGLESALEPASGITLVGSSFDHSLSASLVTKLLPNFIVLDLIARGRHSGTLHLRLDLLRKLRRRAPKARCMIFTSFHPKEVVDMALAEHVAGIYSKHDNIDGLPAVIRFLQENPEETYLSETVQKVVSRRNQDQEDDVSALTRITQREMEVLELVLQGKDSVAIAKVLGISPRTVGTHRSRILHKTKARTFLQLASALKRLETSGT